MKIITHGLCIFLSSVQYSFGTSGEQILITFALLTHIHVKAVVKRRVVLCHSRVALLA